jgi:hypothetical protein
MLTLLDGRVELEPAPLRSDVDDPVEVAFVGHLPAAVTVRPERLSRTALERLDLLGFAHVARILRGEAVAAPGDDLTLRRTTRLEQLPLLIDTIRSFYDLFPDAERVPLVSMASAAFGSPLAGITAWLPRALEDFFLAGGRRAWVVLVDEHESPELVLPPLGGNPLVAPMRELRGLTLAAALPGIGLLTAPDLERQTIPAGLHDVPRVRLPNPPTRFVPCGSVGSDDHRERGEGPSTLPLPAPPWSQQLARIAGFLQRHRPDVQFLTGVPLSWDASTAAPGLDAAALAWFADAGREDRLGAAAARVQVLAPCLRSPRYRLGSPGGLLAGVISASARRHGAWRSVAGRTLPGDALPYPGLPGARLEQLRAGGIGVLTARATVLTLDDERVVAPAHADSGEIVRLIGWLRRRLERLGERLVFLVDPEDPRPQLALEALGNELHARGALRGNRAAAWQVAPESGGPGQAVWRITVAPAAPIDGLVLTVRNEQGRWLAEALHG